MKTTVQGMSVPDAAHEALRKSESLLETLAEHAPVVVWVMDASGKVTYISRYWQEFTGRDSEQDIGFKWAEAIHPDDSDRAARELMEAASAGQPSRGEYRVRRVDGEYAWLRDYSVPFSNSDGSYGGRVGTCMDITDHKIQEKLAQRVQENLILGQEAERKRVARELHDDVAQRIALFVAALHDIQRLAPQPSPVLEEKLRTMRADLEALAEDVHRISHNLHPSTLANLGLVAALRRLCSEFSEQMRLAVDFRVQDISDEMPEEVALAIFRVTQESLANCARHSKSRTASVSLTGHSDEIRLTIADQGEGFDVSRLGEAAGLGLISMQERARILGGNLDITSSPSHGTKVQLRLPKPRS